VIGKNLKGEVLTKGLQWVMLIILLGVGFAVRLVNIHTPPLDFHPVRQLRSALIARGYFFQSNPNADPALRAAAVSMMPSDVHEPPLYEQIVAVAYQVIGSEQLWISRIFSSLFWLIGGMALFSLAQKHTSYWAAMVGLAFYLCLPFSIIASRSFQPDPWMVMWILLTAWSADRWADNPSWKWTILTGILGGITIFIKVMAGFFIGGFLILVVLAQYGLPRLFRSVKPWVMAGLVLVPAVIFYLILNGDRSSVYFNFWTVGFASMLITSKFYVQWLGMINTLTGLTLFITALLGVVIAGPRFRRILIGLWIGYVVFGLAWPFQYTTHDYYHLALVPAIGLSITPVIDLLIQKLKGLGWFWRVAAAVILLAAAGYQAYGGRSTLAVQDFSLEPRSWQKVGESIPVGESFVALVPDYGLRLNYFGWRKAAYYWPAKGDLDLDVIRNTGPLNTEQLFKEVIQGRNYFLVAALLDFDGQPDLKNILTQNYPVFYQGNGWMIYDLAHPKNGK
jgi:hypothetical protein